MAAQTTMSEAKLRHWMAELGPRLINLSTGICRDRHQAEEIVQEAFIKLWRKPPDAGEVVFPAWMRRVVTNLSINALKRTKRPGPLPEFSADPAMQSGRGSGSRGSQGSRPEASLESSDELARIHQAMDRLDTSKRAILMLRAYEQLSYEAIAEHLGVPVGTVMSRLNRARAALAEEMEKDQQESEANESAYNIDQYRKQA